MPVSPARSKRHWEIDFGLSEANESFSIGERTASGSTESSPCRSRSICAQSPLTATCPSETYQHHRGENTPLVRVRIRAPPVHPVGGRPLSGDRGSRVLSRPSASFSASKITNKNSDGESKLSGRVRGSGSASLQGLLSTCGSEPATSARHGIWVFWPSTTQVERSPFPTRSYAATSTYSTRLAGGGMGVPSSRIPCR